MISKSKFIATCLLLTALCSSAMAQYTSSSYFIKDTWQSNMQNASFTPRRGYLLLPVIGGTSASFSSNSLSLDKLIYPNPNTEQGGVVSFLDVDVDKSALLDAALNKNNINVDASTTLFGVGFYSKRIFWTFGSNIRLISDVTIPGEVFNLATLNNPDNIYNIRNLNLAASAYLDNYIGASVKIGKLSVGAKVKFLAGIFDASGNFDKIDVALTDSEWTINATGNFDATIAGLSLGEQTSEFEFENIEYNPEIKTSGMGFGVDLGASYDILKNLTVSLAVNDLGYIKWDGNSSISAQSSGYYSYTGNDFSSSEDNPLDIDEILQMDSVESEDRTKFLNTTINAAAEYRFLNNRMAAGVLYTSRLRCGYTQHEITAVASLRPTKWFTANVSYSALANQIGAAVSLHPCWISLFFGMDYIPFNVTPQYIPTSAKNLNLYMGIGIPLSKKRW